jgi:beta-lactam-binding protein with PASTA domain
MVPDLIGLSPAEAKRVAEDYGLRLFNGAVGSYGVVASQSPRAGARVSSGTSILISVQY